MKIRLFGSILVILCLGTACSVSKNLETALRTPSTLDAANSTSGITLAIISNVMPDTTSQHTYNAEFKSTYPPQFYVNIHRGSLSSEEICVKMWQGDFWEPGNQANDLLQHLKASTNVSVDGEAIPKGTFYTFYSYDSYNISDGKSLLGSHGGDFSFCFMANQFKPGTHSAVLNTTTLSGKAFSFPWQFQIKI